MFNYNYGIPVAYVMKNGKKDRSLFISEEPDNSITNFDKIELHGDESFQPIGNKKNSRALCWAILGANGAGKSYQIGRMLNNYYLKQFPSHPIYLFSEKLDDAELDKIKRIKRIELNNELLKDPITLEELHGKSKETGGLLCIFDDIDSLETPMKKYMYALITKIFNVGRSYGINIIVTNHAITNGNETKAMLNECSMISTFPKAGYNVQMRRFWEQYVGLNKNEVAQLRKNKGRVSTYYRTIPNCVIQSHNAFIVGM